MPGQFGADPGKVARAGLRLELLVVWALVSDGLSPDELRVQLELWVELLLEQFDELRRERDSIHPVWAQLPVRLLGGLHGL